MPLLAVIGPTKINLSPAGTGSGNMVPKDKCSIASMVTFPVLKQNFLIRDGLGSQAAILLSDSDSALTAAFSFLILSS